MQYFHTVLDHFWKRWRREYLLSLRDCHRYSKGNDVKEELCIGDVVVLYDESSRRGFWKLAKVDALIKGADEQVRGAVIRVPSRDGRTTILRRPVNQLYPLEISCNDELRGRSEASRSVSSVEPVTPAGTVPTESEISQLTDSEARRPQRAAAQRARDWMQAVLCDD